MARQGPDATRWRASCSTLSTATLADHAVAATYTAEPGGCSAAPGTVAGGYQRRTCHTLDIIQEHNRKIAGVTSSFGQTVEREISVTCDECHSSAAFLALSEPVGRHV